MYLTQSKYLLYCDMFIEMKKMYGEYKCIFCCLKIVRPKEILHSFEILKEDFDLPGDLYNDVTALIAWFHSFEYIVLATFWFKHCKP